MLKMISELLCGFLSPVDPGWSLSDFNELAQIAAFASATAFFVWKAIGGFLYVNLAVNLDVVRSSGAGAEDDYLVATLRLQKGKNSTLQLDSVSFSIEVEKIDDAIQRKVVDTRIVSDGKKRPLFMPPEDEMQFSQFFRVPKNTPCCIEGIVQGKTLTKLKLRNGGTACWKATSWSAPLNARVQDTKLPH